MTDDIVERLRSITWIGSDALCRDAANEIEELRKERDDARLEIWENHPRTTLGAREYADARGWAPFMEENENA